MTKMEQNFEIWAGTDHLLAFQITGSAGGSQDMTGATASWILQDEVDSSCYISTGSGAIAGSIITVRLTPTTTCGLSGIYYHELGCAASGSVLTLAVGTALINRRNI